MGGEVQQIPAKHDTTNRITKCKKPKPKRKPKHEHDHKKLPRLPPNASISKRPLLHPALPSPYANHSSQPKAVYVSAKTPFLSAVKRVEKLLHLAEKRAVQCASTLAKQQQQHHGGKRGKDARWKGKATDEDRILEVAEMLETQKAKRAKMTDDREGAGEAVLLKGTGKAIQKVLQLALWFQQRSDVYAVQLRTGSVGAIDDVSVGDESTPVGDRILRITDEDDVEHDGGETVGAVMDGVEQAEVKAEGEDDGTTDKEQDVADRSKETNVVEVPETRMRYTSSLEAAVKLR